jgi:hypothetical protein
MANGIPTDEHGCLANEPSRSRRDVGAGPLHEYEMRGAGLRMLGGCDERNCTFWTIVTRFVPNATGNVCGGVLPEICPRILRYLVAAGRGARRKWAHLLGLYVRPAGKTSILKGSARRVSRRPFVPDGLTGILAPSLGFSELVGARTGQANLPQEHRRQEPGILIHEHEGEHRADGVPCGLEHQPKGQHLGSYDE